MLRWLGIEPILPERGEDEHGLGVWRWFIERTISWLHQFRPSKPLTGRCLRAGVAEMRWFHAYEATGVSTSLADRRSGSKKRWRFAGPAGCSSLSPMRCRDTVHSRCVRATGDYHDVRRGGVLSDRHVFIISGGCHVGSEARFYARRVISRDRHHRDSRGPVAAGDPGGARRPGAPSAPTM